MSLPPWPADRYPHAGHDGPRCSGFPCPECGHLEAEVVHLEPPYGGMARCLGTVVDPDWGIRRPCGHEFLIAF